MQRSGRVKAGSLLLLASLLWSACEEDKKTELSVDSGASTVPDGGQPAKPGDSGSPQAMQPPPVSGDAGSDAGPMFDSAALIANATLPQPEPATGPEAPGGTCGELVNEDKCDTTKLPIVFVHGTVANADSFAHPAKLFASNGYCSERIRGIEYHSLMGTVSATGAFTLDREATYAAAKKAIDAEIAFLREKYKVQKVDLAGHSQGARHGERYAREHPENVAHYMNLAGADIDGDPSGVPTLALSSIGDRPANSKVTKNVVFQDAWLDHSAVASSTESFIEMYKFLNDGKEPKHTTVQCGDPILLEGKAQTFADNVPLPVGGEVQVYEVGATPRAEGAAPKQTFKLAADGSWGPFTATRGVQYEFRIVPPKEDTTRRPARAYFQPFVRSDRLLRFNFETKDPIAGATSSQVNRDASFAIFIPRSRQKAFLFQRDLLTVDNFPVITRENSMTVAPTTGMVRSQVIAAYYLFDKSLTPGMFGPGDGKTTGESIIRGSFVNSADVFIPTTPAKFVEVKFNGRTLKVPNFPSDKEGAAVIFLN